MEKQIDERFLKAGHYSRRVWGSNGEAIELHKDVDNDALLYNEIPFRIQAKARKKLPEYITPIKEVDAQAIKEDRGEPLMVMRMDKFFELLDTVYDLGYNRAG